LVIALGHDRGTRDGSLLRRPERAADVDNSSREQPEWASCRGCHVLRGIVDARACGMLGFRAMRREHALRPSATNTCRGVDMELTCF
jgi:hypothetical protein